MPRKWTVILGFGLGCGPETEAGTVRLDDPTPVAAECPSNEPIPDDQVVARWEGGQLTYGQLQENIAVELRTMDIEHAVNRYDLQSQALDQKVTEALLEAEAKRLGHPSVDALVAAEVDAKVPQPTEQEIAEFYPTVARRLGGASLEEATPILRQELLRRASQTVFSEYLGALRSKSAVKLDLPYPELPRIDVPITDKDAVRGPADARVTIVQFAEYQCYYCGVVAPTLDRVLETYPKDVRLVFKDYTLPGHDRAIPAGVAAHCAGEQDKYWEMNRTLLGNQSALEDADLSKYGKELGLDLTKYESCRTSGKYEAVISANAEQGQIAGVRGTPAFFVNGLFLSGALPFERFQALIERELAQKP